MILEFDNNPNLTPEEKVRSLKESVQRALEELMGNSERLYKSLLSALGIEVTSIRNDMTSITERLEAEAQALAQAVAGAITRLEAVEEVAEQIEPILNDIAAMKTRLTNLETNYTSLAGRVGTLEANYTALERRVKALEDAS
jgi:chromosome segregation ATPase